jgi:hypothetical protein
MVYTIVLGVVIIALGASSVVYTFWHEGSPITARKRPHDGAS